MKLKKNSIILNVSLVLIGILLSVLYFIFDDTNIIFFANVIIMIFTIIVSKVSYFSIKSVVVNYLLFSCYFQYNMGASYGILETSLLPLNYLQINSLILLYNILSYIWISSTNILKKEREYFETKNIVSLQSAYFCSVIAIACALIAFPGLPFSKDYINNRFVALLPGNAWNHLSMVAILFAMGKLKDSNFVKFSLGFVMFWFLSHYERVDIIGLIALLFIVLIVAKNFKIKFTKLLKYAIIAFVILTVMIYIGDIRNNSSKFSFSDIARKILVQSTASDIGHVFNVATNYYNNEALLMGQSYMTYVVELIPFLGSEYETSKVLYKYYPTPGGSYILAEPLINFGIMGIIVFHTCEFLIYKAVLSKNTRYRRYIYFFLIISVFRTTWYGLLYMEKAVIYFIPITYLICNLIDRKVYTKLNKKVKNELIEGVN